MENKRVPLMHRYGTVFAVFGFCTTLLFQNCDGGFHYDPQSGQLSSLDVKDGEFRLTTFNPAGFLMTDDQVFEGGLEYKVVASGRAVDTATLLWQLSANTGSCVLKAGAGPEVRYVTCSKTGAVSVQASAVWEDGSTSVLAMQRSTTELIIDACGPSSSMRTVFRIANGTGANPWNSSASPLVVFVGQVLRICNDDMTAHRLFTNGTPCAAQATNMTKGQFYDCAIGSTMGQSPTTLTYTNLYDANAGTNATFNVRPYDGVALYSDTSNSTSGTQSCASCHSDFATSTRKGRSFQQIKAAIANSANMVQFRDTNLLTDDEIRAIAFSLSL